MHFRVAIAPSLVSSQARTALPTPTPPTSSAVRPTRLRKEPSRSTMRRTWGAASSKVRTCHPASRNVLPISACTAPARTPSSRRSAYWW